MKLNIHEAVIPPESLSDRDESPTEGENTCKGWRKARLASALLNWTWVSYLHHLVCVSTWSTSEFIKNIFIRTPAPTTLSSLFHASSTSYSPGFESGGEGGEIWEMSSESRRKSSHSTCSNHWLPSHTHSCNRCPRGVTPNRGRFKWKKRSIFSCVRLLSLFLSFSEAKLRERNWKIAQIIDRRW